MYEEVIIDKEIYQDSQESLLGTPLWELDDELKYSHLSSLKKFLYRKDTLYGLGKVVELSIGEYKAPVLYINSTREEVSELKIPITSEFKVFFDPALQKLALIVKDGVPLTPQLLLNQLKSALNYYLRLKGPLEVMEVLNISLEGLLSFLRSDSTFSLTYEKGIELEGLLEEE